MSAISSTVAVSGRLQVLEMAPDRNGWQAAIIRMWPSGSIWRGFPAAQSKTA